MIHTHNGLPVRVVTAITSQIARLNDIGILEMESSINGDVLTLRTSELRQHCRMYKSLTARAVVTKLLSKTGVHVELGYDMVTFRGGSNGVDIASIDIVDLGDSQYKVDWVSYLTDVRKVQTMTLTDRQG